MATVNVIDTDSHYLESIEKLASHVPNNEAWKRVSPTRLTRSYQRTRLITICMAESNGPK